MTLVTVTQTASVVARDEVRQLANAHILIAANSVGGAAGCATATVTSKVKTVNSVAYRIDGAFKTAIAGTDNFWILSGTTVAVAMFQKYLLLVDAAGTASIVEGIQASTAAGVVLPTPPQSKSIFGVLIVATDATHTFVPGTTLLGAAGITATYIDGFDGALVHPVVLG